MIAKSFYKICRIIAMTASQQARASQLSATGSIPSGMCSQLLANGNPMT